MPIKVCCFRESAGMALPAATGSVMVDVSIAYEPSPLMSRTGKPSIVISAFQLRAF